MEWLKVKALSSSPNTAKKKKKVCWSNKKRTLFVAHHTAYLALRRGKFPELRHSSVAEHRLGTHKTQKQSLARTHTHRSELGLGCNLSTQQAEARGSWVWDQPGLHS
jgi:hypothetical protein